MSKTLYKTLTFIACLLLSATSLHAATLSSTVNRNQITAEQIAAGESLILTVSYDEQVESSALDYSVLERDFDILRVVPQSNSSISVVNGRASRVSLTAWSITLRPKNASQLVIPAFTINSNTSDPITINSEQNNTSTLPPMQAQVIASSDSVYPNQQLIVELEISAQSGVRNLNGPELVVQDAHVELLEQNNYQQVDNGLARQIVTLKYAVFAEQAGELIIPRMTFTANQGRRRGQTVVARTEQLPIKVKELPASVTTSWLPAENVEIRSEWSGDVTTLKVGEPLTRTITVTAQGQQAKSISPLQSANEVDGIKLYKDQPQLHSQTTSSGFVGTRIESSAVVATREGSVVLPEIAVDWWNVTTNQLERAILPAETLTISGTTAVVAHPEPVSIIPSSSTVNANKGSSLIRSLQLALLAVSLICLAQFWIILKLRKSLPLAVATPQSTNKPSETKTWKRLQSACTSGDATQIRLALLLWSKTLTSDGGSPTLYKKAQELGDAELETQLTSLDRHLYKGGEGFDSMALQSALKAFRQRYQTSIKNAKSTNTPLKPLYAGNNSQG